MSIYRVPERIERDGRLIAFAGEIMTEEEAAERGILPGHEAEEKTEEEAVERGILPGHEAEEKTEEEAVERELKDFSNSELKEYILEHGGEFKTKATHAELLEIAEGLE